MPELSDLVNLIVIMLEDVWDISKLLLTSLNELTYNLVIFIFVKSCVLILELVSSSCNTLLIKVELFLIYLEFIKESTVLSNLTGLTYVLFVYIIKGSVASVSILLLG